MISKSGSNYPNYEESVLMANEMITTNQEVGNYNNEQIKLIKDMYAKRATNDELKLLMYMSNKYGLDILTKQIWCIKFGEAPAQIYAGREGFLEIAHKSGQFNGMETKTTRVNEPLAIEYSAWENKVKVIKVFKSEFQFVSTCTVYRKDMEHPITVEVHEEEYSTGQGLWQTKRRTMIAKVAESQCLRKAFSISGIYADEEMIKNTLNENKATTEEAVEIDTIANSIIDYNKVEAIKARATAKGINQKSICFSYNIDAFDQMTFVQWEDAMNKLELRPDKVEEDELKGVMK